MNNIQNDNQKNQTIVENKENEDYEKFKDFGGVVGETRTDRSSTFQSHSIRINNIDQILKYLMLLKSNNKIQKATHNIYAFRLRDHKQSANKPVKSKYLNYEDEMIEGFEDDGEAGAGERLLGILRKMKVYNILIVVSRWYGGIQLGHERFKHINDSAKKLILSFKNNYDWIN